MLNEHHFMEVIAGKILDFKAEIKKVFEDLSDEDLAKVPEIIEKYNSKGSVRVTEYDEIVEAAEAELALRKICQHMDSAKLDFYCLACQGICHGLETHKTKVVPEELQLSMLSRKQLIHKVLQLQGYRSV